MPRRRYSPGRCDDCGWHRNVTRIYFWSNGYAMNVCAQCIKPYRKVILAPCHAGCIHQRAS